MPTINLTDIEWTLSDAENARLLLCHPSTIQRLRKSLNIAPVNPRAPINWSHTNWRKSDPEIARAKGCSVGAVRLQRERLGKPKVPVFTTDWTKVDWTKPTTQLAKELRVSPSSVAHRRAILAKGVRPRTGRPRRG